MKTSILARFDAQAAGEAARAETRNRERHLPPTSLYRWWARRTSAVTGGVLDAAAAAMGKPQLSVADCYAGGGVIALTALLDGHRVAAQEIDPWAATNLAAMATPGSLDRLGDLQRLLNVETQASAAAYATQLEDGTAARLTHTFRVATASCPHCAWTMWLYPSALVTRTRRVDGSADARSAPAWFACPAGHLHQAPPADHRCPDCGDQVELTARYTTARQCYCAGCGEPSSLADLTSSLRWEPVLVERTAGKVREFAPPNAHEQALADEEPWTRRSLGPIPVGAETRVLAQYGFADFADLYPARQLAAVSGMLDLLDSAGLDPWCRAVGRACVIGSAEFAGRSTRWDPAYLKPYETLASHRYSTSTFVAEIDPWGVGGTGRGTVQRRLAAVARSVKWLAARGVTTVPKTRVSTARRSPLGEGLTVITGSSVQMPLPDGGIDLILTDPPYHDDVQYAELASLFRAWAGEPVGWLLGDVTARRGKGATELVAYEEKMTSIFTECRRVLRPGGHLVLSFANREPSAWAALLGALQAAGWEGRGYALVHAENETDHAKSGRRACTLDVICDLALADDARFRPTRPAAAGDDESAEGLFCRVAGEAVLRVGHLAGDWRSELIDEMRRSPFTGREARTVAGTSSAAS